ncbi:hypothetical protein ACLOJK_025010 [Asimina triloba]
MAAARHLLYSTHAALHMPLPFTSPRLGFASVRAAYNTSLSSLSISTHHRMPVAAPNATSSDGASGIVRPEEDDGVSLGSMKLPLNTDLARFETLLFQWANSLCQGANLPLPVPLKVDKIKGGVRLGFIKVEDGVTEVCVHIDCLVFPQTKESGPFFRAVRNGPLKDEPPPGEPRIMRSLLQALQKCVEIARI